MIRDEFDNAVTDFKLGYVAGGLAINKTYASYVSESLRNGNGIPMSRYNKNNNGLNKIKKEIETDLAKDNKNTKNIF